MSIQMQMQFKFELASSVPRRGVARQEVEACGPSSWKWVEASVWTERMLATLGNGVKGGKWYSLIDKVYNPRTLKAAWKRFAANRGAAGIDKISINHFRSNAQFYLKELERDLRSGVFQPSPVRRVNIPKDGKKTRPLGIPTVKDRIVQTALKMVLEPIFENVFLESSYGFRPGRGCKDELRGVDRLLKEEYTWVMIRYADDWVVLCRSLEKAKAALSLIQSWIDQNGLQLSPEKTHVGNSLETGHGFEFLGYRFEDGCRHVSSKSLKRFKDKIRLKTRRTRGDSIEQIILDLNPTIKGWFEYFKHAHHSLTCLTASYANV